VRHIKARQREKNFAYGVLAIFGKWTKLII